MGKQGGDNALTQLEILMEHSCNCRHVMEAVLVWVLTVRAATDQQQVWAKDWQHCGMRQKKVL